MEYWGFNILVIIRASSILDPMLGRLTKSGNICINYIDRIIDILSKININKRYSKRFRSSVFKQESSI